jgi:hypothetical protein
MEESSIHKNKHLNLNALNHTTNQAGFVLFQYLEDCALLCVCLPADEINIQQRYVFFI